MPSKKKTNLLDGFKRTDEIESAIVKIKLTQEEKLEVGNELAGVHGEIEELRAEAKSLKAELKSKIDTADAKAMSLAALLRSGVEAREIECRKYINPKTREVVLVHPESEEILKRRPATEIDLQLSLY